MAHETLQFFDLSERTSDARLINAVVDVEMTARWWGEFLPPGAQKDAAMQHLLEAKDAACRAALQRPEQEKDGVVVRSPKSVYNYIRRVQRQRDSTHEQLETDEQHDRGTDPVRHRPDR